MIDTKLNAAFGSISEAKPVADLPDQFAKFIAAETEKWGESSEFPPENIKRSNHADIPEFP